MKTLGRVGIVMADCLLLSLLLAGCSDDPAPRQPLRRPTQQVRNGKTYQTVQEYFVSFKEHQKGKNDINPFRFYTHLGTDYGRMGPAEDRIEWSPGVVSVDVPWAGWAGMWHSLEGLACQKDRFLDFAHCYPAFIRGEYQPRCVGLLVRVRGRGDLKLEIKSPDERVLWTKTCRLKSEDSFGELVFDLQPEKLRQAKLLNWVAEPGTKLDVDAIELVVQFPKMPYPERVFLMCYAKLARCYSPANGIVKDRANFPAGDFDCVPTTGMFSLATCAAWRMGMVSEEFARQTLRKAHRTISALPTAYGLLPHFLRKYNDKYAIDRGTEYSTVDTAIYYHAMLLAAQMLQDKAVLSELTTRIKKIRFTELRDSKGWIVHGIKDDGRTKLPRMWRDWGGETALVLLLTRMAEGPKAVLRMDKSGKAHNGVGFIPEIQSLFYPHFSQETPDAVTGTNWLKARRDMLSEQMNHFPKASAARRLGLYGCSAGEGRRGVGYVANGTRVSPRIDLIHPHYIMMSAALRPPKDVYSTLQAMEARGLFPPWGLVENVAPDLGEFHSLIASLNASFETISAYHLWAQATGQKDHIYEATRNVSLLTEAIQVFYPQNRVDRARAEVKIAELEHANSVVQHQAELQEAKADRQRAVQDRNAAISAESAKEPARKKDSDKAAKAP